MRAAAEGFGIPLSDWLDLSTGINPRAWPLPEVPACVWNRLPEADDGLESAAARYYSAEAPLPLAGSQAAIQALPRLRAPCRVGVPDVGYQEHAHAWLCAGHEVVSLPGGDLDGHGDEGSGELDCLVVINPNNPTGRRFSRETLLGWHERLAARGGWLLVDEAFMDPTPAQSLLDHAGRPGLIILRSLGKFFGLAGARVGFLFADERIRTLVEHRLGPWSLTGPSRWVAARALEDRAWQTEVQSELRAAAQRLASLLTASGLRPSGGTPLFQWVQTGRAESIHKALAAQGILTRLFAAPSSLRFGLPGDASGWGRLEHALRCLDLPPEKGLPRSLVVAT
ncbi:threonine-phosphate decarboxylase [Thiorhodococcus mannitoliphagus]|uniref:threonine-phosphate decarboxylase n=1 Tax=Thiorhodococcus mannitoliphagus TaxID=329406 RepID=A0A6P1DNT1_9GAMM|nr:threonine-phosphate decarboxylase CobD [Thiorhodococcus mannitoliphagus]NEX19668.1 threonine-phosphate decarboxylase [Thiorhodococcus mannitoliphagus]